MMIGDVPKVAGEQVVSREHEDDVHDQVQYQKHTLQSWWNGTPADWVLAVLAESRREKQVLSDPQTQIV
jgi:hypothetical protein